MNHEEFKANDAAIETLVRAVAPPAASAATYAVLIAAARQAVDMTSVRADGQVHHDDVLAILRCALGGIPKLRVEDVRKVAHDAVLDVALAAPRLSTTTLNMLAAAIADRVARELDGRTVKFVRPIPFGLKVLVREAADAEIRLLLGCGAGMDPDTSRARACDAIADRVEQQLVGRMTHT